jgi:hypothetical protein
MFRKDSGQHHRIVCPFELKELSEDGTFSGYGAVFGNIDLGGDKIIGPKPFKQAELTKDKKVRILYQHDTDKPIGKSPFEQEEKGLYLPEAQLVMDMPYAMATHAGMKSGLLDGLSIGYDVLPNGSKWIDQPDDGTQPHRELSKLKLWEVSVVTFGMNPKARIDRVKSAQGIRTKREFEEFLREAGFTAEQAKSIAACGFKEVPAVEQPRDVGDTAAEAAKRISALSFDDPRDAAPTTIKGLLDFVENFKL